MNEIITQNRPPASGVLSIDLETFSSVDLPKCGVYRYVESPDFEILLFAYAFDDEEVQIIDMACGEKIPKKVLDALEDGASSRRHGTHSLNVPALVGTWGISFPRTAGAVPWYTLRPSPCRCP